MTPLKIPRVDALHLASHLSSYEPTGVSVELQREDRVAIRDQIAKHLAREIGLDGPAAARFLAVAVPEQVARTGITAERIQ